MRHCPSQIPATYPAAAPDIKLPELDGKTVKMYHGGKICTSIHFNPLWARNAPHLGIAHALIFGVCHRHLPFFFPSTSLSQTHFPQLAPWLATEIPHLVESGMIARK